MYSAIIYALIAVFGLYGVGQICHLLGISVDFSFAAKKLQNKQGTENKVFKLRELESKFNEYSAGCLKNSDSDGRIAISSIEDYFNMDMIDAITRARICELIPGLLTGLGLLGTFLGLIDGLQGVNTGTVEEIANGIDKLLGGMSTAFMTSIAGVGASLAFSAIYKVAYSNTERKLERFLSVFSDSNGAEVEETPINKILTYQYRQTELLQTFAGEVSHSISTTLAELIAPVFTQMSDNIEKFSNFTTMQQQEGLEKLVGKFVQSMDDNLGKQFQELASAIELTSQWQKNMLNDLQAVLTGIKDTAEDVQKIRAIAKETADELKSYVVSLHEITEKIHNQIEYVEGQVTAAAESAEKEREFLTGLNESAERLATISDCIVSQTEAMETVLTTIEEDCKRRVSEVSRISEEQVEQVGKAAEAYCVSIMEQQKAIEQQMQAQTEAISNWTEKEAANLSNALEQQVEKVGKFAETYCLSIAEQQKAVEQQLQTQITAISNWTENEATDLSEAAQSIENAAKQFHEDADNSLQRTFDMFDTSLAQITSHLAGTIADVRDTTENVPHLIRQSQKEYEKVLAKLTEQTEKYTKAMEQLVANVQRIDGGDKR